jgi:heme oxygenase-like protein
MLAEAPALPSPRGPLSAAVIEALSSPVHRLALDQPAGADPLADDDLQLALYLSYELHYRGFRGVDERWEWEPSLLRLRQGLEQRFESALLEQLGDPLAGEPVEVDIELRALGADTGTPSLSRYIESRATLDQLREFLIHRSAYQLKEADPHSWALPRLHGRPKAALVEIQTDEYGGGRADRIHAQLFADAMTALGLDAAYGAYLDRLPGITLASVNLMSLFGLHRRWRGALVGHLALFEITSSIPNRRYANGVRRLGFSGPAVEFFDEHVLADAVHDNIAAVDLAGGLVGQEPAQAGPILWGARALGLLDEAWSDHLLASWKAGNTSLRSAR